MAVDLGADTDIYLARVDWSKDGKTLYVQRQTRDQKRLDILAADPATGKSRIVLFIASKDTPIERHLYVTSYKQPGEPKKLTSGHGWWTPSMADTPTAIVAEYSDSTTPPQTAIYDLTGKRIVWIEENRLAQGHPYFPPTSTSVRTASTGR